MLMGGCSANEQLPRRRFKAAVYEHEVILPEDPKEIVSRDTALTLMKKNLAVYELQAAKAKRQGADILVFPEDGLYGFQFTWNSMGPYMEHIPSPAVHDWVPCDSPDRFPNTEVQHALSCMAKNHSLFIVANMGDRQPCHKKVNARCRVVKDTGHGHFQYNTDVAFDPHGKLVAKYHKKNLFYENQFDTPVDNTTTAAFDTPFGRWTMFTCFDILFYDPAVASVERGRFANVAFPTAWMDALPLLASVQFHSAFARGLGVNFLAANIHKPQWRFQGSGVYSPEGMAAFDHNATVGSAPRLLVTELDVLDRPQPPLSAGERLSGDRPERSSPILTDGDIPGSSAEPETAFVAELFHDLFNFVQLDDEEGSLEICHNQICCRLNYSMNLPADPVQRELFAFGAFDGLHTYEGQYYLQICALVRCASQSRSSCGQPTNQSSTLFQRLFLRGENFDFPQHVYPEVLLTTETNHLRLAEQREWRFRDLEVRSDGGFSYPLLSAALFGRVYGRDVKAMTHDRSSAVGTTTDAMTLWAVVVFTLTGVVGLF